MWYFDIHLLKAMIVLTSAKNPRHLPLLFRNHLMTSIYIKRLMQGCGNSIAIPLEASQACSTPIDMMLLNKIGLFVALLFSLINHRERKLTPTSSEKGTLNGIAHTKHGEEIIKDHNSARPEEVPLTTC